MSQRRACRLVNQPRGTQRYQATQREDALTRAVVELASQYGRYGYRRIAALLNRDGWQVGKDPCWSHVALAGSRLYVKDHTHVLCYDLSGG